MGCGGEDPPPSTTGSSQGGQGGGTGTTSTGTTSTSSTTTTGSTSSTSTSSTATGGTGGTGPDPCGDGMIAAGEGCDDGNDRPGDGCSEVCEVEPGFTCAGAPSVCAPICGDGEAHGGEGCDDGNTEDGDGCDATCVIEEGFACVGTPSVCAAVCGDGIPIGDEECDDGDDVSLDGCNPSCQVDVFFESEPNDALTAANGPYDRPILYRGSIAPASDADVFAVQLLATTDLTIETFDANGPGSCANIDTVITLLSADGDSVIAADDDAGIKSCSKLDSKKIAALRHLPAGTYLVKVETYDHYQPIPGYTVAVSFDAVCGDGKKQGAEECDGGAGCTATCDRIPVCGDGFVDGAEQCDDGNVTSGDGCSAGCLYEVLGEVEPNGTAATATGPHAPNVLFGGAISPASDADYFAITLPVTADLRVETFDATGPSACAGIDTVITLFGTDGTTALITRDQGGVGNCSRIDPARETDAAARHLPPGTYFVKVESFLGNATIPGYTLLATYAARCGDGVIDGAEECDGGGGCTATCDRVPVCGDGFVDAPESCDDGNMAGGDGCSATCQKEAAFCGDGIVNGAEECDGGAGCDASCNRIPACGDGLVDAPETCDDGNTAGGDGCSATCQIEAIAEVEPNGTVAEAGAAPVMITATATIAGAIGAVGDRDLFPLTLAKPSVVRLETFDPSGNGCSIATTVRLLDAAGAEILADDNSGIASCSALVVHLAAGAYHVGVERQGNGGLIPAYLLEVRVAADAGAEIEPNDTKALASPLSGGDVAVLGAHQATTDTDFYAINVPAGRSIRAEIVEGGAETCESLDVDSYLTLYDASGVAIAIDDDGGRGFCSRIDGTGAAPVNAGASSLPGGTYYLAVEAAPFAQSASDTSGQFDYRLVITVR